MKTDSKVEQLHESLRRLGWIEESISSRVLQPEGLPCEDKEPNTECWLRRWLESPVAGPPLINVHGRARLKQLVSAGWTLRSRWPRPWSLSIAAWLGARMFLGHASLFAETTPLHSLISSRIGRHGNAHPEWPIWIDGALRHARRHAARMLISPGSTLAEATEQFARGAGITLTKVCWSEHVDVATWLDELLKSCSYDEGPVTAPFDKLFLSPAIEPATEALTDLPLQDRLSIALADRVLALSLRAGGKLEELVGLRLAETAFPVGSLFITLPTGNSSRIRSKRRSKSKQPTHNQGWLTRGAVGWIMGAQLTDHHGPLQHCQLQYRESTAVRVPTHQFASPLPRAWRDLDSEDDWPYLVHCTRGTSGPLPEESEENFRHRVWCCGGAIAWHPLETLAHICREGRLRGTASITRTSERCVSFSAVPLSPLLKRRTFRSHLGRWDWEPYGLLIRRECLKSIGARDVIYGDEHEYDQLTEDEKPFFQPRFGKGEQPNHAWAEEREWRVLGDVDLRLLPRQYIMTFVRTRHEAIQFCRYSPWPVLWVE